MYVTFVTMDLRVGLVNLKLPTGKNERIHCAILCADIVGYTKFCAENEAWTHEQLVHRFKEFEEIASKNKGHIARLRGDSILILLEDAESAVFCAMQMQKATDIQNQLLPKTKMFKFRIAVHEGMVIFDNDEPYGNVVNYTVRLQQIAKPGSIYVSEAAKNSLKRYFPLKFNQVSKYKSKTISKLGLSQQIYEPFKHFSSAGSNRSCHQKLISTSLVILIALTSFYGRPIAEITDATYYTTEHFE